MNRNPIFRKVETIHIIHRGSISLFYFALFWPLKCYDRYNWADFVWLSTYWYTGLSLWVVCIPSETLLEKINFSLVSDYQLEILSGLWWVLMYTSALSSSIPSGRDQCIHCACCHCLYEFQCASVCVRKILLSEVIYHR